MKGKGKKRQKTNWWMREFIKTKNTQSIEWQNWDKIDISKTTKIKGKVKNTRKEKKRKQES